MLTKNNIWPIFIGLWIIFQSSCREETIIIEEFGTVNGYVYDSNTLLPINGVSMSTSPSSSSINTDSLGYFELADLSVGNYSLKTGKDGYRIEFVPIAILKDRIVVVNINLNEESSVDMAPVSPELIAPLNESTEVLNSVELKWTRGENYTEDDLLFDVILINEEAQQIEVVTDYSDTTFLLENLDFNTTYLWYVVAKDDVHPNANSEVFSFETGEISSNIFLFVRRINGLSQVFSSDPDGLNESNMTDNNTNNWCPRYSPDGTLVSYISVVNNANHIFIMDANGNNSRKITSGVQINYFEPLEMDYSWSPDGTKILYMNFNKLYLQDINETGGPANPVITSPDGNAFASCDWKGNSILARTTNSEGFESSFYIYNATTLQLLDTVAYFEKGRTSGPYFSEGGGKIVFTHDVHVSPSTLQNGIQRDAQIFLIEEVSNPYTAISISDEFKPAGTNDISARFSPSGAFVIFSNQNIDGLQTPAIYRMNIIDENARLKIVENAMMPDWRNL
jgi:WD40-like Beta Propeller Repeat